MRSAPHLRCAARKAAQNCRYPENWSHSAQAPPLVAPPRRFASVPEPVGPVLARGVYLDLVRAAHCQVLGLPGEPTTVAAGLNQAPLRQSRCRLQAAALQVVP